jgi:hypothetical protein
VCPWPAWWGEGMQPTSQHLQSAICTCTGPRCACGASMDFDRANFEHCRVVVGCAHTGQLALWRCPDCNEAVWMAVSPRKQRALPVRLHTRHVGGHFSECMLDHAAVWRSAAGLCSPQLHGRPRAAHAARKTASAPTVGASQQRPVEWLGRGCKAQSRLHLRMQLDRGLHGMLRQAQV